MECTSDLVGVIDPHIIDPFPRMLELREQHGPIIDGDVREELGARPTVVNRAEHTFTTLGFEACTTVLRDPERFSSSLNQYTLGVALGRTMLELDPPEHTVNRGLVQKAFRPRTLERWTEQVIVPTARNLVREAARGDRVELVRTLAVPLPMRVITRILGLPDEFLPQFEEWAFAMLAGRTDPDSAVAAADAFSDYVGEVIEQKRHAPEQDLISDLVGAEVDGVRLSDDEVLSFLKLLFPAGAETTFRQIGNLLHGLFHHPDQLAAVRADRDLIPRAIDESLRWQPAVGASSARVATGDHEVFGVEIPQGSTVIAAYASVNRDPERWQDPDRFDIHRPFRAHVAFGNGPHTCLGMHLAKAEMRAALEAVLDLLPGARLDPDAPDQHVHSIVLRGPCAVPVAFDRP